MTWKQLKDKIDNSIKQAGLHDYEVIVWYLELCDDVDNLDVHVKDLHHPGEFEVWTD